MKYTITLLLSVFIIISCDSTKKIASNNEIKIDKDSKASIYANTITRNELKDHLYIFASDKFQGRETGKEGQKMAEKYLISAFKKMNVKPGNNGKYTQEFELVETMAPNANISVNEGTFYFGKDFYFFPAYAQFASFKTPVSNIYDITYGIKTEKRDDYGALKIKDKILVMRTDVPEGVNAGNWTWTKKLALAKSKGAKAVIFVDDNFNNSLEKMSHYFESPTMKLKGEKDGGRANYIPFFFVSNNVYTQLFMENSGEGKDEMKEENNFVFDLKSLTQDLVSSNVLGFIEGSDPELKKEIIVLTAHYDHIGMKGQEVFNGADDDGSGTVALLELAQAFQKAKDAGHGTKRSILVMPVSGEEKGLLGSKYYTKHPVYELEQTVCDLNIDMIGRLDKAHADNPNYIYLIGADKISKELHNISEACNKTYTNIELDYTFNDEKDPNRFYYRSDHYNFAKNGIPVIFYFNGVHEDYHKATDTFEKIDFEKMETITRLVFHTAWEVANRDKRLVID